MCWNREVSFVSGFTATALCIYLLIYGKGNDIPIALVSLAIALMQFAEAFLWVAIESGKETGIGGRVGLIALFLQPLMLGLGIGIARGLPIGALIGFFAVWAFVGLPVLLPLLKQVWPSTPGSCGHLQWSFLKPMLDSSFAPLYWIVMLGGWLFMKPLSEGIWYSSIALGTLGITAKFFPGEWGSLWCFLANFLPLGRILW
jgi:hypothetical protein